MPLIRCGDEGQTFLQQWLSFSARLVPGLVSEGKRIGKAPFCVDGLAESQAASILGPSYAQETHEEYRFRHFTERPCGCRWCQEFRWDALECL